jgi:hypothetical protein
MEKLEFTFEQLKELMAICLKIGAESPELAKMPKETINAIATGMIKDAMNMAKNANK